MKAFFTLRDKAHAMLADGRSRQLIVAQLLADPCFGEFLEENRLTQDLTVSQKVDLANTVLVAAVAKEVERTMTEISFPKPTAPQPPPREGGGLGHGNS